MKLVGFNFKKIKAEKFSNSFTDLKVNVKIDILKIEPLKTGFFNSKGDLLEIEFDWFLDYGGDIAKLEIGGKFVLELDSKISKEVLNQWKDKKLPEDFRLSTYNLILRKANLKALQLEEELNLPIHIQLPSLKAPIEQKE